MDFSLQSLWAHLRILRYKRFRPSATTLDWVKEYYRVHPEMQDSVKRATYAYHNPDLIDAHDFNSPPFPNENRHVKCRGCGRTREQVRWDGQPPQCSHPYEPSQKPHRFTSSAPWGRCIHCETTRETAKSDECPKWQSPADICAVIHEEEKRFEALYDRARNLAATLKINELTGEKLSYLHHTHGIDPSMLESVMEQLLPEQLHIDYEVAYEKHEATGKRGEKKVVIVAK